MWFFVLIAISVEGATPAIQQIGPLPNETTCNLIRASVRSTQLAPRGRGEGLNIVETSNCWEAPK